MTIYFRPPNRELGQREMEVVELIRQAKSNREIAHALSITEGTVKEYVSRIFQKLGVTNRTAVAVWRNNAF